MNALISTEMLLEIKKSLSDIKLMQNADLKTNSLIEIIEVQNNYILSISAIFNQTQRIIGSLTESSSLLAEKVVSLNNLVQNHSEAFSSTFQSNDIMSERLSLLQKNQEELNKSIMIIFDVLQNK